ncbi:hypothetical protein HDV06_000289 [Boothiomyces sp. JEL0866]|nr:hypothetical protein HDV06_000289 [Boothiomyces sp. JEL0866]
MESEKLEMFKSGRLINISLETDEIIHGASALISNTSLRGLRITSGNHASIFTFTNSFTKDQTNNHPVRMIALCRVLALNYYVKRLYLVGLIYWTPQSLHAFTLYIENTTCQRISIEDNSIYNEVLTALQKNFYITEFEFINYHDALIDQLNLRNVHYKSERCRELIAELISARILSLPDELVLIVMEQLCLEAMLQLEEVQPHNWQTNCKL